MAKARFVNQFNLKDGISYYEHAQLNAYVYTLGEDIKIASASSAKKIAEANLKVGERLSNTVLYGFDKMEKTQHEIHNSLLDQTSTLKMGFDGLDTTLNYRFDDVSNKLSDIRNSVDNVGIIIGGKLDVLNASFNMGMASIVTQFELQRDELKTGFNKLSNLLENSGKTKANEKYIDGKGWFINYLKNPDEPPHLDSALKFLKESLDKYEANPFVHILLGHIYEKPSKHYNLKKALNHYNLTASYAKGIDNSNLVAQGYFYTGWIYYAMSNVDEAIIFTKKSLDYEEEKIPEAYYNLAKFYAHKKDVENALYYLNIAVKTFDPNYTIKADTDPDFEEIRPELDSYFFKIRDEEAEKFDGELNDLGIEL